MALLTHSKFYFNYEVDTTSNAIDFDEGGAEIQATVTTGSYTFTEYALQIQSALNQVGGQTYTVTIDRDTRLITITAPGTFALLITSGTRIGNGAFANMGYTGADLTGAATYQGNNASGSEYRTQFKLQSYIPSENFQRAAAAVLNTSISGKVEVIRFGTESFIEANFKYITDVSMPIGASIRNRATGVADFRTFWQFMITKAPFEFMKNEKDSATFEKIILESTPSERQGIGYKMNELTNTGLVGFFESRTLKFRVVT